MKVLIASFQSITMVHGGPHTQVLETARHLRTRGVDIEFIDPWKSYDLKSFDLAHVFSAGIGTHEIAVRLDHFKVPLVVSPIFYTSHSPRFVRGVRALEKLANRVGRGIWTDYGLAEHICRLSRVVLPNTTAESDLICNGLRIPRDRITVIPNGVDDRFAQADPELFIKTYGIRHFVLNVGHIGSPRKNVLSLIRAVKSLDVPCVIIGKVHRNRYSDRCLQEAALNKNVRIIEGLPNNSEMLASAYAACDTFVLPSFYETPGIAALEAALAGAKIVITPHGGTLEYFGREANYVDPTSVKSIRHGILAGLNRTKSAALAEHIRKEFLWTRVAEKTLQSYHHALSIQ